MSPKLSKPAHQQKQALCYYLIPWSCPQLTLHTVNFYRLYCWLCLWLCKEKEGVSEWRNKRRKVGRDSSWRQRKKGGEKEGRKVRGRAHFPLCSDGQSSADRGGEVMYCSNTVTQKRERDDGCGRYFERKRSTFPPDLSLKWSYSLYFNLVAIQHTTAVHSSGCDYLPFLSKVPFQMEKIRWSVKGALLTYQELW